MGTFIASIKAEEWALLALCFLVVVGGGLDLLSQSVSRARAKCAEILRPLGINFHK